MKSSRTATKWTFWWDCFLNSSFYFGPQLWATWECKCVKLWGTYCMLPSQNVSCQVMLLPCCLKWTWATQEHVVNDSLLAEQPIYQLIFSRHVFSPQSDKITSGPTTPLVCLTLFHVVKWQASLVGCFITTPWLPTIPSLVIWSVIPGLLFPTKKHTHPRASQCSWWHLCCTWKDILKRSHIDIMKIDGGRHNPETRWRSTSVACHFPRS